MIKGVKAIGLVPFILPQDNRDWDPEKDDPKKRPTVWMIAPQTVQMGNRNLAGYLKSQGKGAEDEIAAAYTKQDLNQFLRTVKQVYYYCFSDADDPVEHIEGADGMKKVFDDLDYENVTALMNASKNIFTLRDGEKNALSSLSGAASNESTPAGSDTTATDASRNG